MTLLSAPPLSLYIHFPWCVKKCPYCDFNSHTLKLLQNLDQSLDDIGEREILSIFMGGGTPSLFSERSISTLLDEIRHRTKWRSDIEITLEANPGTVEQQRFKGYFEAGINRVSLGIQSLNDVHLNALGRIHSADNAKRAVEAVKTAGSRSRAYPSVMV
jgi:coproporphyrinogen III oxidase-like Fe-S oxidoreductase